MQSQKTCGVDTSKKPVGGYVQISALSLGVLTWANSQGLLSSRGVRVGLGLFELRARRTAYILSERKKGNAPEFTSHYSTKELGRLCGLPTKRVSAALKELFALGFLTEFSETEIRFASSVEDLCLTEGQRSTFRGWFSSLTPRYRIPIPRRALVLACESSSRALVVFILGACLRCCWRLPTGFRYSGRLSCPWLAANFGICLTAVKRAKKLLVALGWIKNQGNVCGTLGELVAINPAWHRLATLPEIRRAKTKPQDQRPGQGGSTSGSVESAGTKSDLEPGPSGTKCDPPIIRETPSEKFKYQDERETQAYQPEPFRPGIFNSDPKKFKNQDPERLPPPRLSAIRPEDFKDVARGLEMFRQAVKCQLVENGSENSRIRFFAAIEKARTVPAKNPAGLFLWVLKGKRWSHLSEGHYEAASRRLKAFLHERAPGVPPLLIARSDAGYPTRISEPAPDPRPRLSKDALLVKTLREELARRGQSASVFAALHSHGGWDRNRYAAALTELEKPQVSQNAV